MKTLFKAFLVFIMLGGAANKLLAQDKTLPNSFAIVNNTSPNPDEFYRNSIAAADMEQYRLRDKRLRLEFENGFEVELYSAKELFVSGQALNLNLYQQESGGQLPVFAILPNGHLTAKVFNGQKK